MNSDRSSAGDILIVDDRLDNLRLLSAMLSEQGYDVRGVTTGSAALMGSQAQPPDLILLDINLPGMNGYEVCQQLKAHSKTEEIPVIFLSAYSEAIDKVKAFAVGGVDYITKPFQAEEVLVRIETQLRLGKLQAELQERNLSLQQALEQQRSLNQKLEEMTAVEERNRIARDIHDSLGHSLVALNVQIGAAISLWQKDPNEAHKFLLQAKRLGSDALAAVRQSVAAIRSDPFAGELFESAIANLIEEFHSTSGILPESHIERSFPSSTLVNRAVYRLLQEGLTNICKYAEATAVKIQIQTTATELLFSLEDNGKGFEVNQQKTGFGLQGMEERVTALGGQLEIVSAPNRGCCIRARFPTKAKRSSG
ncbi:MAG: response regulator [Cyanosarcina radialis HA8281-LM2]|jgi:signal transduction histidine kinase|nr:response regulator [Cyanosarcina radialis HA8281-LM2]